MRIYFLLSLFCCFAACTSPKQEENINYTLQKKELLNIPLDSTTRYETDHFYYYKDKASEKNYLVNENRNTRSLQFYDIDKKELDFQIKYDKEGPDGIRHLTGSYVKNLDSIYICAIRAQLVLTTREGKVVRRYGLQKGGQAKSYAKIYTNSPILKFDENNLYIKIPPYKVSDQPGFWDGYLGTRLQLDSGLLYSIHKSTKLSYLHDKTWGGYFTHYSMTANTKGQIIYSLPMDSKVHVADEFNFVKSYEAQSKFFEEKLAPDWQNLPPEARGDSQLHEKFYVESNSYREIFYDQWRDVYYRFAYRALDNVIDQDGKRQTWDDKPKSIIILDKDFQKIGETELPLTAYTRDVFVAPKGLYISNNHPKNEEANEDYFSFTCYELVKEN